jgi:hypothetical protein
MIFFTFIAIEVPYTRKIIKSHLILAAKSDFWQAFAPNYEIDIHTGEENSTRANKKKPFMQPL